jgi:hypothetical protein
VVVGVEPGEWPQPARQLGQVIKVDVPAVAAMFEVVMDRCPSQMGDEGPVQRWCAFHMEYSEPCARRMGMYGRAGARDGGVVYAGQYTELSSAPRGSSAIDSVSGGSWVNVTETAGASRAFATKPKLRRG